MGLGSSVEDSGTTRVWKLPTYAYFDRETNTVTDKALKKANKYLRFMERQVIKAAENKNPKRLAFLTDILIGRSNSFMSYIVWKYIKDYY